jgi:hypothetical protein
MTRKVTRKDDVVHKLGEHQPNGQEEDAQDGAADEVDGGVHAEVQTTWGGGVRRGCARGWDRS